MCRWKIHPQWNCLNSRSSADVTGTVSAEGDLDWCGIWHEGNGSALSMGKLSVKCCHCIKACLCVHMPESECVCGMHVTVQRGGVHVCHTHLGVLVMTTAGRNCCSRQEQTAEYEWDGRVSLSQRIRIMLSQHQYPKFDFNTNLGLIFMSHTPQIRKIITWFSVLFFCGFVHGSRLSLPVCSVSKMHVVDYAWWAVWSHCLSQLKFICLAVRKGAKLELLASFKPQILRGLQLECWPCGVTGGCRTVHRL